MDSESLDAVAGGGAGATYPGRVVSGTGNLYVVDIFKEGLDIGAAEQVSAVQIQIGENETIPVGTGVMVSKQTWATTDESGGSYLGTQYTMQVAVWM